MSITSLNEFIPLINQQLEIQEALSHQLFKTKALLDVALSSDFLEQPTGTIQLYLLAVNDMAESSQRLSEQSLEFLQKNFPIKINFDVLINT